MDEEIKVTPEMVAAGEQIIDELYGAVSADFLARSVYIAMARISHQSNEAS